MLTMNRANQQIVPIVPQTIPAGSVLEMQATIGPVSVRHPGILGYTSLGQPMVAHNSKRHGRPVVEPLAEFAEGQTPQLTPQLAYRPSSAEEGEAIIRSANADLQRGQAWTPWNNCEHFVSRAVTGKNHSPSWAAIVVVGVGLGLFALARG